MNNSMKAVKIHAYGGRDQLKLQTTPIPSLKTDDVLVKIHAAAVNPVDWKVREGYLVGMLPQELPLTLGWDFSGEVVALGENVKDWQLGAAVYSRPDIVRNGSYAEYIAVDSREIAAKPTALNWQEAAAVPLAALTAWQVLYEAANLEQGQRVLIHAGAGGVGHIAIQLAKLRGAYVYTTASSRNVDYLKSLGADEVIDYTQQDFSELKNVDVVFDTLGGEALDKSWQCLTPNGILVSIVTGELEEKAKEFGVRSAFVFVQPSKSQLDELTKLFDANKLKITIDSEYALDGIVSAHERSESGRVRGKVVVNIL